MAGWQSTRKRMSAFDAGGCPVKKQCEKKMSA
jgi:hypothetical protein